MKLDLQVAYYILTFHPELMTDEERKAQGHLLVTMKATMGRTDETAQREAQNNKILSGMLCTEPSVLRLAKDGYQKFQLATAARILKDSGDKVFFNRCPSCGEIARTPSAKQCRYCRHDWHENPAQAF